ncbi:MAG TPA: radical SAM protein [bacterium]
MRTPHVDRIRRSLGLLGAVAASNFRRLRHPTTLSFAVTWRCNLRCRTCNIWRRAPTDGELTPAQADDFFRRTDGFRWVGLTGGEPLLRPDLAAIVDAAARCRTLDTIQINTNGQLREAALALLEHVRRRHPRLRVVLTVSVDGPPDVHNRIRGKAGAWERAAATFVAAKSVRGVKAQVGYTICADNLGRFAAAYEALRSAWPALRFDDVNVNVFQTSGHYYGNEGMAPPDDTALFREIDAILALDRDRPSVNNALRRRYLRLYQRYLAERRSPLRCQALSVTCFLDPAGDLYPCVVFPRVLANVRSLEGGLRDLWGTAAARALHRQCSSGGCPACWSPCNAFSAIGGSLLRAALT